MAFLDRANLGFAKSQFQLDTGLSDAAYAFGAGIFFIGYALVEVPSNLMLERFGARLWMCRIMVSWGLVSAATAFVRGETAFYLLRFLLGVAEAGFFPGVILYLSYWFPQRSRGKALGLFYFGAPIAFVLGSPLSGLLLELHGAAGLRGWQWLFLVEGLLASLVGVAAWFRLDDRPRDARWLPPAQRELLAATLEAEDRLKREHGPASVGQALADRRVLGFGAIYLLIQMSVYGVVFYLPSQVASLMGRQLGFTVGLVAALPWLCALLAAYWVPVQADRHGRHRAIAAATLAISAAGIAASVASSQPVLSLVALCFAAAGFIAEYLGWRAVFCASVAALLALAVVIMLRLPRSTPTSTLRYPQLLASLWHLAVELRELRYAAATGAAMFAAFSAFWPALTLLLAGAPFHYGPQAAGLFGAVGAAGALAAPYAGKSADKRGPHAVIALGIWLVAISFAIFAVSASSLAGLVIGVIVLDVGVQAAQISNQSRIYALKPEARSRVNTVYMVCYFIGGAIGSSAGVEAWHAGGWLGVSVVGLLFACLAGAIHHFGARRRA
ncbi:MFS transporter [Burkholderia sp. Ap-962]|uniref:MFS transporter n=1 Tax=Burkholderia sp. Ap-962 TaxID=2608333 RepID=UPI001F04870D|nr:MFS transporter [Burkholderia sp. Ap-962]